MDWLFRRHFWLVHVLFLASCAFVVAKTINSVVSAQLIETFKVPPRVEQQQPIITTAKERYFEEANNRNIFQSQRENIPEFDLNDLSRVQKNAGRWQDAELSSMDVQLVATAVFYGNPRESLATIIDSAAGEAAQSYSINECTAQHKAPGVAAIGPMAAVMRAVKAPCNQLASGLKLVRIEPNKVYFFNEDENQYEYIEMSEDDGGKMAPPPSYMPLAPKAESNIKQVGQNAFQMTRADFDRDMANLSKIATQARAVPVFAEDGKTTIGFKLFQIQPDSIFTRLGLKDGDVVRAINGYKLDSPDKALELYSKLKNTSNISIDKESGGTAQSVNVSIVH